VHQIAAIEVKNLTNRPPKSCCEDLPTRSSRRGGGNFRSYQQAAGVYGSSRSGPHSVCATVCGVTVAVHWSVAPESIVTAAHFTDTNCTGMISTPGGGADGIILMAVLPTTESCTLVAVTVTVVAAVTVGAVSTPAAAIAPEIPKEHFAQRKAAHRPRLCRNGLERLGCRMRPIFQGNDWQAHSR